MTDIVTALSTLQMRRKQTLVQDQLSVDGLGLLDLLIEGTSGLNHEHSPIEMHCRQITKN